MNISIKTTVTSREKAHSLVDRLFSELDQECIKYAGTLSLTWETNLGIDRSDYKENDTNC